MTQRGRGRRVRQVRCLGCEGVYLIPAGQKRLYSYEHCPYCEDCRKFRAVELLVRTRKGVRES